ncbi:AAA-ATPase At2g46620 [Castanea sativa]|uniref:AAA-ATPase At2g46620 n=1 Tax=Castanea sativa TaxID=21020 RepID=UPI003F64E328
MILQILVGFVIICALVMIIRMLLFKTGLIYTVKKRWRCIENIIHVQQVLKVPEFNESMQENQLYRKVSLYLNSLSTLEDSDFTNLVTGKKPNDIVLCLDPNQTIDDNFLGAKVTWTNSKNCFVLSLRKADKRRILRPYLQHIHTVSDEIEQLKPRDLKLYTNVSKDQWRSVPFTHPSTFETITMEEDLKTKVKSDLESFLKGKQYYHRLGRVWRRSFLLYGPSGTGKSSFVAAMANFLSYDVYDIDVSKVSKDSDLNSLLLATTSRSIIVIEDFDRFLMEKPRTENLSVVMKFMDGILNSCVAEERLMVFTMNSKEHLHIDPAVLRPGRIDVHIHFPLCDFSGFKSLASTYLGVKDHKLFAQVGEIFQTGATLSPAEIGELMISNRNSPSRAIKSVITALQQTDGDAGVSGKIGRSKKFVEEVGETGGVFCNETGSGGSAGGGGGGVAGRELRKLYGFLRMKSNRVSHSFDSGSGRREGR